jgi:hypothetical protein
MKRTIISLALLFAANASFAAGWRTSCRAGDVTTGLAIGQFACQDPDADSPALNIASCENVDIFYWTDRNADGTASTNTVAVRSCASSTTSGTACWPIQNVTLTGVYPNDAIYGASGIWVYADFDAAINNDPRLIIHCNGAH